MNTENIIEAFMNKPRRIREQRKVESPSLNGNREPRSIRDNKFGNYYYSVTDCKIIQI
jgi:hypothetical protein